MDRAGSAEIVAEGPVAIRAGHHRTFALRQDRTGGRAFRERPSEPDGSHRGPVHRVVLRQFRGWPTPHHLGVCAVRDDVRPAFGSTAEFYDWQEQTDWLDWAVYFGFRLADGGEWDATYNHAGIDFEILAP